MALALTGGRAVGPLAGSEGRFSWSGTRRS
jgi:hypothetical protein